MSPTVLRAIKGGCYCDSVIVVAEINKLEGGINVHIIDDFTEQVN